LYKLIFQVLSILKVH